MKGRPAFLLLFIMITAIVSLESIVHLHVHGWCPPCKKALTISKKLQKAFPQVTFITHEYTGKALLISNSTKKPLPFPNIMFECSSMKFSYQNDLTYTQLGYWIEVICLKKIPECSDKINSELYHILIQENALISDELLAQMINHPHIKLCKTVQSNITSQKAVQVLRETDKSTLYLDYFSNNVRDYLIQSKKIAVAILTNQKNTSRVNSFFQTFANIKNFTSSTSINQTSQLYHYEFPAKIKEKLIFLQLCRNENISKCVYNPQRKSQVHANQKMIERLLHFLDLPADLGQQIIVFQFQSPIIERHVYHNFGNLDEKFLFWINEIASKENKKLQNRHCYWNTITHRVSENSLEDIQHHLILSGFLEDRMKKKHLKPFSMNKITRNYHSEPKMTICFEGKSPINYQSNKQIQSAIGLIQSYDSLALSNQL